MPRAFLHKAAMAGVARRRDAKALALEKKRQENNVTLHERMLRSLGNRRRGFRSVGNRRRGRKQRRRLLDKDKFSVRDKLLVLANDIDDDFQKKTEKPPFRGVDHFIDRKAGQRPKIPVNEDPQILERMLKTNQLSDKIRRINRAKLLLAPKRKALPSNKKVLPLTVKPFCPHSNPRDHRGLPINTVQPPESSTKFRFPVETEWRMINEHKNHKMKKESIAVEKDKKKRAMIHRSFLDHQLKLQSERMELARLSKLKERDEVRRNLADFLTEKKEQRKLEMIEAAERRKQISKQLADKAARVERERKELFRFEHAEAKAAKLALLKEQEEEEAAKVEQRKRNAILKRENQEFRRLKYEQGVKILREDKQRALDYIKHQDKLEADREKALKDLYAVQQKRMNLNLYATKDVREQARLDGERAIKEQKAKERQDVINERQRAQKRKEFNMLCKKMNDEKKIYNEKLQWDTFYENKKIAAKNKQIADEHAKMLDDRRRNAKAKAKAFQKEVVKQMKQNKIDREKVTFTRLDRQLHSKILDEAVQWQRTRSKL